MAGYDRQALTDRITKTLADATREMTPLETFAQVGRAAAQAATSDKTFGDVMNAQKAERIQAVKQMSDFLAQQRQLELADKADQRAAEQLDIAKDNALFEREKFGYQKGQDAENLSLRKAENERADERMGLDRERMGMERDRLGMERDSLALRREAQTLQNLQFAADREDADAKAVMDALSTLIPEEERAAYAARLEQLPYDVNRHNALATVGRLRRQIEESGELPEDGPDFKSERDLRKDFDSLAEDFITVRDSYGTLLGLANQLGPNYEFTDPANTGPGDLSLIFAYMKMLDPGSTVREGEVATAENARGKAGAFINLYNSILQGAKLTPEQRRGFLNQAASQYKQRQGDYDRLSEGYRELAKDYKMDPANIVLDHAGPYRYRVMSDDELMQAIDAADDSQRAALEAEVNRRMTR